MSKFKKIGPGAIVAAAFIGPGTVTTASIAGSSYGYTLLWAVLFSVIATFILQEMSVRLGVIAQLGVGEALQLKLKKKWLKIPVSILVIAAIVVGNAAYEAGNISGATIGFRPMISSVLTISTNASNMALGLLVALLLLVGTVKIIQRFLMGTVAIMGLVFIMAAIMLSPDITLVTRGLFLPVLPEKSVLMVIGLIGTTVVPYNLFLHASFVKQNWQKEEDLKLARLDSMVSIGIGGLITMCILIASTIIQGGAGLDTNLSTLSESLVPIFGSSASMFIGVGFLAAGLSSAITAPLAAAFATSEIVGGRTSLKSAKFRAIWILVVLIGVLFSSIGFKPTEVIVFAQIANGLLLPVIAIFLVWIMNDKSLFGKYANSYITNALGVLVIALTLILGIKGIVSVF